MALAVVGSGVSVMADDKKPATVKCADGTKHAGAEVLAKQSDKCNQKGGAVCPSTSARPYEYVSSLGKCSTKNDDAESEVDVMGTANSILNMILGIIGFVAVVMVIVGGFQYATSSGDAAKVTKAKNTIMYGIIGMVIALLAYAIVNFVLGQIFQ